MHNIFDFDFNQGTVAIGENTFDIRSYLLILRKPDRAQITRRFFQVQSEMT
jgi:hypothetical protein